MYKIKKCISDDEPKRYKAWLVAKGFIKKEGVDLTKVFFSVVRQSSPLEHFYHLITWDLKKWISRQLFCMVIYLRIL